MIHMDVRHDDVGEIRRTDPERLERCDHLRAVGARTGFHEAGLVRLDQVHGVELRLAGHPGVDRADALGRHGVIGRHGAHGGECRTGVSVGVGTVRTERREPWSR